LINCRTRVRASITAALRTVSTIAASGTQQGFFSADAVILKSVLNSPSEDGALGTQSLQK
jgi:hypothetical protein